MNMCALSGGDSHISAHDENWGRNFPSGKLKEEEVDLKHIGTTNGWITVCS